jgi:uncharacterized CHY-type Zn-finger protein
MIEQTMEEWLDEHYAKSDEERQAILWTCERCKKEMTELYFDLHPRCPHTESPY